LVGRVFRVWWLPVGRGTIIKASDFFLFYIF
jgi:hypothetical protein